MTGGKLHPSMIKVFLNGRAMHVPKKVEGHYAVRGWLGIQRGWSVGRAGAPLGELLVFERGHEFAEGDRYVTRSGAVEIGKRFVDEGELGPISSKSFAPENLVTLDSLPRQPWDEGKPVTCTEVETLKAEFDELAGAAIEAEAFALAAWVYYGGLKAAREMGGDPA